MIKLQAYCAFLQPILDYACQVWNHHSQQIIKQIEPAQLCVTRWICGAHLKTLLLIGHYPYINVALAFSLVLFLLFYISI